MILVYSKRKLKKCGSSIYIGRKLGEDASMSSDGGDFELQPQDLIAMPSSSEKKLRKKRKTAVASESGESGEEEVDSDKLERIEDSKRKKAKGKGKRSSVSKRGKADLSIDLDRVFEILDTGRKGFLTTDDVLAVVKEVELDDIDREDVATMLFEADKRGNKNGEVDIVDFKNMMNIAFSIKKK